MIELRILGPPETRKTAGAPRSLHLPAKPLAVLAWLSVAGANRFVRRDTLLPLFWPEQTGERARNALSQTLHRIRRALGGDVIEARGMEELRVAPALVRCDVIAFERAVTDGHYGPALDLYRGPLLDGLYLAATPDFENWLDLVRERLRRTAADAARSLATREEDAGNPVGTARWLRRLLEIAPEDENALRRLMVQLDRAGDRPGAMRAYRRFVRRLDADFGLDPSAETEALAARLNQSTESVRAPGEGADPSVAVLPFTNLGDDPEQTYFCHGMTEELMTVLAGVPGLRVSARSSVFTIVETADPATVGRKLNVDAILQGSVRRAGDRLRVSARLVSTADGSVLRSFSYDRSPDDVFTVQDDIARSIADALRVDLLRESGSTATRAPTRDLEAHSLYLRGLFHRRKRTAADLVKARDYLEQAVGRDPAYAQAHAALAFTCALSGWFLYDASAPIGACARARTAVAAALALDSDLAEAHLADGCVRFMYDWAGADAERAFRRALALDPGNADALGNYSGLLVSCGRFDEAIAMNRSAQAHDPTWIMPLAAEGLWYFAARRYDQALVRLREAHELEPDFVVPLLFEGDCLRFMGKHTDARQAYHTVFERVGRWPLVVGRIGALEAEAGRRTEALARLDELRKLATRRFVGSSLVAGIHVALGDREGALRGLSRAVDERDTALALLHIWPAWDPLRGDPVFEQIAASVQL
jgi:TolB-like protein/Tfp pilus assembly protein PilF